MQPGAAWRSVAAVAAVAAGARAHHLASNLASVEHYVSLTPHSNGVAVLFDQHLDPFGARRVLVRTDLDHDGVFDAAEKQAYLAGLVRTHGALLHLDVEPEDGATVELPLRVRPPGSDGAPVCYTIGTRAGEQTLRARWTMDADWPEIVRTGGGPFGVNYRGNFGHIANLYSVVTIAAPPPPMVLVRSTAPTPVDIPMPPDAASPLDPAAAVPRVMEAAAVLAWSGPSAVAPSVVETVRRSSTGAPGGVAAPFAAAEGRLRERIFGLFRPPLGVAAWAGCLALCFAWGAMHAMSPGHGKAIVSAYLIGMHARLRHAVLVGTVVTLTHTAVVIVLAIAAVALQDRFVFPRWLQPAGAVVIVLVGLNQLRLALVRLAADRAHAHAHAHGLPHDHGHSHDHRHDDPHGHPHHHETGHGRDHGGSHAHWGFFRHSHGPGPDAAPRTAWELIAVGFSGGMVPCPSGIILLLFALQVSQPMLGLACILAFSLGLATTLIGVGWIAVAGTRLAIRRAGATEAHGHRTLATLLPAVGGLVLVVLGALLLAP